MILTIGGTGIRVSELKFITVEALKNRKVQIHLKGKDRTILLPKTAEKAESVCKNTVYPSGAGISDQKRKTIGQEQHLSRDEGDLPGGGRGSKKVFPHNLRHLFARCFYAVEKNLALLADILGHSSIETTRIYVAEGARKHERILKKMHLII